MDKKLTGNIAGGPGHCKKCGHYVTNVSFHESMCEGTLPNTCRHVKDGLCKKVGSPIKFCNMLYCNCVDWTTKEK
jgi:hypothetical protein